MIITDTRTPGRVASHLNVRVATIATSLSPSSVSTAGLELVEDEVIRQGCTVARVNVAGLPVTFVGNLPVSPEWVAAVETVSMADAVVLALGVHGWAPSAISKATVELLGEAMTGKAVAFVCGMGSTRSHLAHAGLATSLVFERNILWVPASLQLTADAIDLPESRERAADVVGRLLDLARRLAAD